MLLCRHLSIVVAISEPEGPRHSAVHVTALGADTAAAFLAERFALSSSRGVQVDCPAQSCSHLLLALLT